MVAAPGGVLLLMVNVSAPEVPRAGRGGHRGPGGVPGVARLAGVIAACSCVLLTNVVVRATPFQRTTDPLTKFVPVTLSVKAAAPAVALLGASEPAVGT